MIVPCMMYYVNCTSRELQSTVIVAKSVHMTHQKSFVKAFFVKRSEIQVGCVRTKFVEDIVQIKYLR